VASKKQRQYCFGWRNSQKSLVVTSQPAANLRRWMATDDRQIGSSVKPGSKALYSPGDFWSDTNLVGMKNSGTMLLSTKILKHLSSILLITALSETSLKRFRR